MLTLANNASSMDAVKAPLAPATTSAQESSTGSSSIENSSIGSPTIDSINTSGFAKASKGLSSEDKFLHVDKAFKLDSNVSGGVATLVWIIAPEHYLYRHAFSLELEVADADGGRELVSLNQDAKFSQGIRKMDDYFGPVEVFYYQTIAELPLDKLQTLIGPDADSAQLTVKYQGCADAGLCYPIQSRQVLLSTSTPLQ
jgi:thiol:disulfide interchange protein DsbD